MQPRMLPRSPAVARARPARALSALIGLLLAGALLAQPAQEERLTLNFKDADIEALIGTMAELTGRNFVIDPRVKGKVTVISSAPTDREALYEVFVSILKVHGFSAVPSGDIVKIVPEANARHEGDDSAGTHRRPAADEPVALVIPLQHVPASELVPVLRPLLPQEAHLAAHAPSNTLVAASTANNVERLMRIIRRIDAGADQEIELIALQHASATEVVQTLKQIGGAPGAELVTLLADRRTNSVLLGGEPDKRLRYRALISELDTPMARDGDMRVLYLRYASAVDLVPVLQGIGGGGAAPAAGGRTQGQAPTGAGSGAPFRLQADEATNALIIQAPPQLMATLMNVIDKLDVRRRQVLVEGIIAEVSSTLSDELGVQWKTSVPAGDGLFAGSRLPGVEAGGIDNPFDDAAGTSLLSGFTLGYFSGADIRVLLRALQGDQYTNVLSTPTLVTMDNTEAEIVVGQNVPFVTGQFTNDATTPDNPFQTIQRQDVGIVLRVKPQINEGDAVTLDIEQEVSSIDRDTAGADLITNKRSITTSVLVDDGAVIVLGGLIEDDRRENAQKIPLLGDIPVLGHLFRSTRNELVKTNLMVFLRPRILRDQATSTATARQRYEDIRGRQSEQSRHYRDLLREHQAPALPAFDDLLAE